MTRIAGWMLIVTGLVAAAAACYPRIELLLNPPRRYHYYYMVPGGMNLFPVGLIVGVVLAVAGICALVKSK